VITMEDWLTINNSNLINCAKETAALKLSLRRLNVNFLCFLMKIFFLYTVLVISENNFIYAQEGEKPEEISRYIDYLSSYPPDDSYSRDMDTMSLERLKSIARMMYEASEADAKLNFISYMNKSVEAESLEVLKYKYNLNVPAIARPAQVKGKILEKIMNEISELTEILMFSDYFIKGQILTIETVDYKVSDLDVIDKIEIKVKIQDILKGDKKFIIGDELTFFYMSMWRRTDFDFVVGEECFFPLNVIGFPEVDICLSCKDCLTEYAGGSFGRFPIIEGILIDKNNHFGFGEKIQWEKFRSNLIQQILNIKSW
jgi:hypothetical protein